MAGDVIHTENNGRDLIVESGGKITVKSGGQIDASAAGIGGILLDANHPTYVNVTITTAQVLALNATPITLVAAPGAGLALIFEGAVITKAAGTAYGAIAAGDDLAVKYTDGSGEDVGVCEMTGFADQTTAQVRYIRPQAGALAAGTVSDITPVANVPLVAHMLTGEITTGTSDFKLRVFYRVVPTVL